LALSLDAIDFCLKLFFLIGEMYLALFELGIKVCNFNLELFFKLHHVKSLGLCLFLGLSAVSKISIRLLEL
jgi:hypothetical protein